MQTRFTEKGGTLPDGTKYLMRVPLNMILIDITGTNEDPKVRHDARALLARAGEGTKRLATEKITDAIKGFLRKKKQ